MNYTYFLQLCPDKTVKFSIDFYQCILYHFPNRQTKPHKRSAYGDTYSV